MPTAHDIQTIVDKRVHRLAEGERQGIHLKVASHKLDDDWLYIEVVPSRPGVRASDYANLMSKVERELRAAGNENVLLVPVLDG